MFRKHAFWIALAILSAASVALSARLMPRAFPLVQINLTMDRAGALEAASRLMARERLGPPNYDQAASFSVDSDVQTFVELEGGGQEAYARMLSAAVAMPQGRRPIRGLRFTPRDPANTSYHPVLGFSALDC